MLTISLIIPVYNEARHIRACLDAVAIQANSLHEVIIVDNNCSDDTISIAREYDFVTVIAESSQGLSYARARGFNYASGDILARIDADAQIHGDWVQTVRSRFERESELAGMTGPGVAVCLPGVSFVRSTLFTGAYLRLVSARFDTTILWGANMALRASWWATIESLVHIDDSLVHEDQDLSLWMASAGARLVIDPRMRITTNGQSYRYLPKMLRYRRLFYSTWEVHRSNGNLQSTLLPRLGYLRTLPARIIGNVLVFAMIVSAVALFPVDYIVGSLFPGSWWLE